MRARTSAALIDMLPVLVLLVGAAVMRAVTSWPWWTPLVPVGIALCWTGLLWWGASADGRTVGKRAMGIVVLDESTAGTPGPWRALGRLALRGALPLVTLGVAGLSYRWDPAGRQRTWWDRVLGTAVILRPDGPRPEGETVARWAPAGTPDPGAAAGRPASGSAAVTGGWVPGAGPAAPAAGNPSFQIEGGQAPPLATSTPGPPATAAPAPVPAAPASVAPMPPGPAGSVGDSDSAGFLAPQLIGGEFRAVPHERGATPDGGTPQAPRSVTGASPTLITGIDRVAGPLVAPAPASRVSSPAGPAISSSSALDPACTVRIPGRSAELVWDTGRRITVTGRVLVGRDPEPTDGEHIDHLLPVTTESIGVSKTHLLVDIGVEGITVTDRRSTNGVRIVRAEGTVQNCPPGEPVPVRPGDAVHFGGRYLTIAG